MNKIILVSIGLLAFLAATEAKSEEEPKLSVLKANALFLKKYKNAKRNAEALHKKLTWMNEYCAKLEACDKVKPAECDEEITTDHLMAPAQMEEWTTKMKNMVSKKVKSSLFRLRENIMDDKDDKEYCTCLPEDVTGTFAWCDKDAPGLSCEEVEIREGEEKKTVHKAETIKSIKLAEASNNNCHKFGKPIFSYSGNQVSTAKECAAKFTVCYEPSGDNAAVDNKEAGDNAAVDNKEAGDNAAVDNKEAGDNAAVDNKEAGDNAAVDNKEAGDIAAVENKKDCLDDGNLKTYIGTMDRTISGYTCQRWDTDSPQPVHSTESKGGSQS